VARARAGVAITPSVLKKPQPHRNDGQTSGVIIVAMDVFTSVWLFTPIHNFIGTQRHHSQTGCHIDHQALQTPGVIIVTLHVFTSAWLFTPIHNFIGTQRYHSQTGCHIDHQALQIFALRRNCF
jgi:hypothetical protein